MALAPYFGKNVVAISQLLGGFTPERLEEVLRDVIVGITFDETTAQLAEGQAILDMLVRLFARLYPKVSILGPNLYREKLLALAISINPSIEIADTPTINVAVGLGRPLDQQLYVGSNGWVASVSATGPLSVGASSNRIGAGIAACLGASWVFKTIFLPTESAETEVTFSGYSVERGDIPGPEIGDVDIQSAVLVGVGAVGNGTLWALLGLRGSLHVLDPQLIELSNLQRYVLTTSEDEHRVKVDLASDVLRTSWYVHPYKQSWAEFVQKNGYNWDIVLVALDSAKDRRSVQTSLPRWIANAWTQLGDLGISTHDFLNGACLSCLYMPKEKSLGDDEIVARALRVPEKSREIRDLLAQNRPASPALLELIAERLQVDLHSVKPFERRPLRTLYVDGLCGGAILPRSNNNDLARDMQVPLAHQSALAGVLLAAALIKHAVEPKCGTYVNRINLMRDIGQDLTQRAQKDPNLSCICADEVYKKVYRSKYGAKAPT